MDAAGSASSRRKNIKQAIEKGKREGSPSNTTQLTAVLARALRVAHGRRRRGGLGRSRERRRKEEEEEEQEEDEGERTSGHRRRRRHCL